MAFKTLGEVLENGNEENLLTLRATKASLSLQRGTSQRQLIVHVSDEMEVITSARERREHFKTADRQWLENQLSLWENGVPVDIGTDDHPLEVITGDACPLLVINGEEYIPSILRDIPPVGWLLPGGCPQNFDEVLDPNSAALREMREELLMGDITGRVYSFHDTNDGVVRARFTAIGVESMGIEMISVGRSMPRMGDADELAITYKGDMFHAMNPVFIDPEIASTAVTLYLRLHVPIKSLEYLRLFDGEVLPNGTALKRPVRLLKKNGSFAALYLNGNYVPTTGGWITETTGRQAMME